MALREAAKEAALKVERDTGAAPLQQSRAPAPQVLPPEREREFPTDSTWLSSSQPQRLTGNLTIDGKFRSEMEGNTMRENNRGFMFTSPYTLLNSALTRNVQCGVGGTSLIRTRPPTRTTIGP